MVPTNRKLRRSRDAAASSDAQLSAYELYEVQGDSAAAMDVFSSGEPTLASRYNSLLLGHLVEKQGEDNSCDSLMQKMKQFEEEYSSQNIEQVLSPRKRKRNEMIFTYNHALVLQSSGKTMECARICNEVLAPMMDSNIHEDLAVVTSRIAFLLLECILTLGRSLAQALVHKDSIVKWLETFDTEKDPQLKFLLSLYKSRLELAELDTQGKHSDVNIRSAKKDLKSAMEVFQHKLRSMFGDSGSVVSSANSEENMSTATPHEDLAPSQLPNSVVLQKLNQSALTLKAHLEQLKGNTKKSLILCSEAASATMQHSSYDVIHSNNLSILYETNNKKHLALHAIAKGLHHADYSSCFHTDGTSCPNQSLFLLYNASICALQAGNFLSAYECMATCISRSEVFRSRPRCWIRMAEACLGIYSKMTKDNFTNNTLSSVESQSETKGLLFDRALCTDRFETERELLVTTLASSEDIEQVKRNPLLRARGSLQYALMKSEELDSQVVISAQLMLSYVYLTFYEYKRGLELAQLVILSADTVKEMDDVTLLLLKRRYATAKLYATEALCGLGRAAEAMRCLVGDGQEDAFDRLASDLGGVTIETAAANDKGKRRLARAQAIVRASASVATATLGNYTAAKKLAMSAQAMEDAYASNRERSSARRALIYSLLSCGNSSAALKLLQSMRLS